MTNGVLNIKHRKPEEGKEKNQKKRQPAYRTYMRGKTYMPKQVQGGEKMCTETVLKENVLVGIFWVSCVCWFLLGFVCRFGLAWFFFFFYLVS